MKNSEESLKQQKELELMQQKYKEFEDGIDGGILGKSKK